MTSDLYTMQCALSTIYSMQHYALCMPLFISPYSSRFLFGSSDPSTIEQSY